MRRKRAILGAALLLAAAAAMLLIWRATAPAGTAGMKAVTVSVVHGDGTVRDFPLNTEEEFLGPALVAGGVVEDDRSAYGLYILTADGETADESRQEWWKLTKGGERLDTGADTTPIADGDSFELTLTTGYDGF